LLQFTNNRVQSKIHIDPKDVVSISKNIKNPKETNICLPDWEWWIVSESYEDVRRRISEANKELSRSL